MDTNERYTGPQPDEVIAGLYAVHVMPRIKDLIGNANLTLEMMAVILSDRMLELQNEFKANNSPAGKYVPSTTTEIREGKEVIVVRLNGWNIGVVQ